MAIDTENGSIPERYDVQSTDNRDQRTTWLWIGRDYVEVDPVELMGNMIENCYNEDMSFLFEQFKQFLELADESSEDIKGQRADYIRWFRDVLDALANPVNKA